MILAGDWNPVSKIIKDAFEWKVKETKVVLKGFVNHRSVNDSETSKDPHKSIHVSF